ncbi:MAG: Wzz/FepE/Etk N-terminal domain-containing protein, partial [Pyrinomonadaceae bacterium]|nr:Wzz/FepE/Etk N-terminal domain-containing protein [Pyrinomonadaceae bacterium]
MEQDQRLTPLPQGGGLKTSGGYYSSGYSSFYDDEVQQGRRTVQQYINIVYKRLPLIIALTVIATAATALYMYNLPTQYQATTQMVIEPRKPRVTSKDAININFGNDVNYTNTQLQLLQSGDLRIDVAKELELYRNPAFTGRSETGLFGGIRSILSGDGDKNAGDSLPVVTDAPDGDGQRAEKILSAEEQAKIEAAAGAFGVSVNQVERTNLVNVSVRTIHKDLAAPFADTLALVFQRQNRERETQGTKKAIDDLRTSIEDLKNSIIVQEADLIEKLKQSNLPLQEKGQELAASRLGSLSETWLKAMESRRQLESRYTAAQAASARG